MAGRDEAVHAAELALSRRYPEADAAFVAGSIVRGEGTRPSDVDLVVLYTSLPNARRESFESAGLPVETFVHDGLTLSWFLENDARNGHAAIPGMVAEGVVIGPRTGEALACRSWLARGSGLLAPRRLEALRYDVTDKMDDLLGDRSRVEIIAIGTALYRPLSELALRRRGSRSGAGKWIPRLLRQADPTFAARFEDAFDILFQVGDGALALAVALAEAELAAVGGRLFDGYVPRKPTRRNGRPRARSRPSGDTSETTRLSRDRRAAPT
jgi:hypothetical protein